MKSRYFERNKPMYPCRVMETRACPAIYDGICGDKPCARFESADEKVWELSQSLETIMEAYDE